MIKNLKENLPINWHLNGNLAFIQENLNLKEKQLETFPCFTLVSLYYKWNGTRLLSPETE